MIEKHVLIVLQTHSKGDSQHYIKAVNESRFVKVPKSEVQRRCTRSLVESINYAKGILNEVRFDLVVYDDHSDPEAIQELKNNLNIATFPTELIHLETHGIMPSILKCYEHGRDHGKGIVYFAQDDYLYDPKAIYDMLVTLIMTTNNLGNFSSIYPFDDPYRYIPQNTSVPSHMIRNQGRHWRTQNASASCFMTSHKVILDNWDLFEAMGKHEISPKMEDNTINKLFYERGYYLFVPIPSLALHMQYSTEMDDQIDWRSWWDKYARSDPLTPTDDKTILNLGFGGIKLEKNIYTDDLKDYREITLDINHKCNPDILADINDISHLPNLFVDAVYSSHMIEHLTFAKVPIVISELLRITKEKGFVRIITPNLKTIANNIATGKILDPIYVSGAGPIAAIDILWGHQRSINKDQTDFMAHKCGFTKEVFEYLAQKHNWNITVQEIGYDLIVDIKKITS